MFNPSLPSKPPTPWHEHALLEPGAVPASEFQAMDWDALPRVLYHEVQFRQLATPEPARVLEQAAEFVPQRYDAPETPDMQVEAPDERAQAAATEVMPEPEEAQDVLEVSDAPLLEEPAPQEVEVAPEEAPQVVEVVETDSIEPPSMLDSESLQQACDEAYQRGLEEGLAQAQLQAHTELEEALANAKTEAQTQQDAALEAQRLSLEQRIEADLGLLRDVTQRIDACTENTAQFFEPLKRLAMHIAEQLVLAELNVSGNAIERLVQRCLDELNLHGTQVITVELHSQDKARLEDMAGDLLQHIRLHAAPGLQPGSVRVVVNDTQVEDLVQNRLEALAHALLTQPEAWREKSPFFQQPLSQRDSEVQDAVQTPALPDPGSEDVLDA